MPDLLLQTRPPTCAGNPGGGKRARAYLGDVRSSPGSCQSTTGPAPQGVDPSKSPCDEHGVAASRSAKALPPGRLSAPRPGCAPDLGRRTAGPSDLREREAPVPSAQEFLPPAPHGSGAGTVATYEGHERTSGAALWTALSPWPNGQAPASPCVRHAARSGQPRRGSHLGRAARLHRLAEFAPVAGPASGLRRPANEQSKGGLPSD